MVNTTKYKAESETLLPRNLKLTFIKKSTLPHQYYGEIPVIVISVSLQNKDQFKIPSGCKKFYLGKLISVKSSYLDVISKTKTDKITSEKIIPEKMMPERMMPEKVMPKKILSERKNITKKQKNFIRQFWIKKY